MRSWRKPKHPIDRAVADLDREIARLQRQIRDLSQPPAAGDQPKPGGTVSVPSSPPESMTAFVKSMFIPPKKGLSTTDRTRNDLFEVTDDPLKELEIEPITFGQKSESDLFSHNGGAIAGPHGPGHEASDATAARAGADARLARYLSAGSIKTYRPLKHARRLERNRFFMWLGLALVTLGLIYVVIR